jgi:hypothetical protein
MPPPVVYCSSCWRRAATLRDARAAHAAVLAAVIASIELSISLM